MSAQPARPATRPAVSADPRSLAQAILSKAQSSRDVIQDFVPLADSLEWNLGQEYLRQRGNKAFLSDSSPVPFIVNNDGTLSRNAAEVFFASLQDAEAKGPLEDVLFVLELGIGVGLFARYFLDAFRDLCHEHRKDYYDRLCYIAADRSARMLLDVCRHGVLAEHAGRYVLRLVDAMQPAEGLLKDALFQGPAGKPLRAVFLNYLLDCLPAAVLEIDGHEVKQLCVRTCVARNVRLEDYTDLTVDLLAERARVNNAEAQSELLEVYGLFASEYDYRPVDVRTLPLGAFAVKFGRTQAKRLLHSFGAIQSVERLMELVHEDGFILANDYGQTQITAGDEFEHQRFSLATFVGVNFSELKARFQGSQFHYEEPHDESPSMHCRLIGHKQSFDRSVNTRVRFQERFGKKAAEALQEPQFKARECARVGRFEAGFSLYQHAVALQPGNWVLLSEFAQFLISSMGEIQAGVDLVKMALALNPTCSSELWNILGDGLFENGRYPEARSAYLKALEVNESDVRARYNLAWVYQREKNYPAALRIIAEGLTLDKMGHYRDRLLQKHSEVVGQQAQRQRQEYLMLVNLVSKYSESGQSGPANDGRDPAAGAALD